MNQEEAQNEFDAIRLERQECLDWLNGNETMQLLLSPTFTDEEHHQRFSNGMVLDTPDGFDKCILGVGAVGSAMTAPNANEAQEQDGGNETDDYRRRNEMHNSMEEPWVLRRLLDAELHTLMALGCRCLDWRRVYLYLPQSVVGNVNHTVVLLQQRVSSVLFSGTVILGWPIVAPPVPAPPPPPPPPPGMQHLPYIMPNPMYMNQSLPQPPPPISTSAATEEWEMLPYGLHNGMICNSWVQLDAKVHQNRMIRNTVVGSHAVVINVGQLTCSTAATWNPHVQSIPVGPESGPGKRLLTVTPQDTLIHMGSQLFPASSSSSENSVSASTASSCCSSFWSVISTGALVRDTTTLDSVYVHPGAMIEGAACVRRTVLFPTAHIDSGSTVLDSFLQWNCHVEQQSHVSSALVMERCHIGPHSKIGDCVLGPDVALSSGEVQSSVLGPNTAAHHQSLLIGMLWLHGRGNVGYGANVGSNHTGRAPDQEAWSGEGVFWGLSNVLVYPLNLLDSPYSIVAAGTKMTPQVVSMPFSLFISSSHGGDCEIVPGWVLSSSPYTLARCERKWQSRRKAKRHHYYTGWPMMHRRDVLQLVYQARTILRSLSDTKGEERLQQQEHKQRESESLGETWYNNTNGKSTVWGLGTCALSEKSRQRAIQTYTNLLQHSALQGLLRWLENYISSNPGSKVEDVLKVLIQELQTSFSLVQQEQEQVREGQPRRRMPWDITVTETWEYQKFLLVTEYESIATLATLKHLLRVQLVKLNDKYATAVRKSKLRDEERGSRILPTTTSTTAGSALLQQQQEPLVGEASNPNLAKLASDPVIQWVEEERKSVQGRIESLLEHLSSPNNNKSINAAMTAQNHTT